MSAVLSSKDTAFEAWAERGRHIQHEADQLTWSLADWAGEAQTRDWPLKEFCTAHGLSYDSAKRAGAVSRQFPKDRRTHQLMFGYYQEVCDLTQPKQEKWLTYAKEREIGITHFRAMLRESEAESGNALLSDGEPMKLPTKHLFDLCDWLTKREPEFWTPSAKTFWKKQLAPIVKIWEGL